MMELRDYRRDRLEEPPSSLGLGLDLGRARILAFQKGDFAMERHVAIHRCIVDGDAAGLVSGSWFAADALTS